MERWTSCSFWGVRTKISKTTPSKGEIGDAMTVSSACPAKGQVDARTAECAVLAVRQRGNAVEEKPRRPAPHDDVAMGQPKPPWLVAALGAAEQEDRRQPERDRDDR